MHAPGQATRPKGLTPLCIAVAAVAVTAAQWLHHGHHTEPAFADLPGVHALLGAAGVAATAALVRLLAPLARREATDAD